MPKHHKHRLYEPRLNTVMHQKRWKHLLDHGQTHIMHQLHQILDLDTIKQLAQKTEASLMSPIDKLSIQTYLGHIELTKTQDVSVIDCNTESSTYLWYAALDQALQTKDSQLCQSIISNVNKVPDQALKNTLEKECWNNLKLGTTNMPQVKKILNAVWKQDPDRVAKVTQLYSLVAFINWWPRRIDCVSWPKSLSDQRLMIRTRPRLLKHMTVQQVTKNFGLDGAQWCRLLKELADSGYIIDYLPPGMLGWINKSVFTNTLKGRKGQKRVPLIPPSVSERPQ